MRLELMSIGVHEHKVERHEFLATPLVTIGVFLPSTGYLLRGLCGATRSRVWSRHSVLGYLLSRCSSAPSIRSVRI